MTAFARLLVRTRERSTACRAMNDVNMLQLFSPDRRREALLLFSPLALLPEVAADPHALWRPHVLQRRLLEALRTRTSWSTEAQKVVEETLDCLYDPQRLAEWLRIVREAAVPSAWDRVQADTTREAAVRLLRDGRPAASLAVLRPALEQMPDHPFLRRLEIAALSARGELAPSETAFALQALSQT